MIGIYWVIMLFICILNLLILKMPFLKIIGLIRLKIIENSFIY